MGPATESARKGETAVTKTETKVYTLALTCGLLIGAAFLLPRFLPNSEGGLAGAASAILAFLLMLGGALLFSLYLLTVTLRQYESLPTAARVAGVGPSVVLAIALLELIGFLRY